MLSGLLIAVREEFDRAAARRVEENAVLRELFARGAGLATDATLASRLREAVASRDESLLVPALDASNRSLRALLIALHAHVETLATPPARELEAAIWRELAASTERVQLGPLSRPRVSTSPPCWPSRPRRSTRSPAAG